MKLRSKADLRELDRLLDRPQVLLNKEQLLRPILLSLLAWQRKRIFQDGTKSDGTAIGTYSASYIKYQRMQRNWGSSSRVILALTEALRHDYKIYKVGSRIGLGVSDKKNWKKIVMNEKRYGPVFDLTRQEQALLRRLFSVRLRQLVNP
jgi:hypothetical protein